MKRSPWVLWFLLITLLARPVFAVAPVSDFTPDIDLSVANTPVSAAHHGEHCDMSNENAISSNKLACCDEGGCGIDCSMAGCFMVTLPISALLFHASFLTLYDGATLSASPVAFHFPILRPPIA